MAPATDLEIDRIKYEVDLIRLIQDSGVTLRKVGAEMKGLCLFHRDEHHPSLSASPARQLWRCFTCGAAGDCFTWVMRRDHVGFAQAKAILIAYLGGRLVAPVPRVVRRVSFVPAARDHELLHQAVTSYSVALRSTSRALDYLASRGLGDARLIETFRLGFGGPVLRLGEERARLQHAGLLRPTGHHHFAGCITAPVFTERGEVGNICGRRLPPVGELSRYLVLPGPRAGIWNWPALVAHDEIILCEGIIDGLTLIATGFPNVIACLGVEDFCMGHLEAIKRHGVRRALIAFDRDEAGDRGAVRVAGMLALVGVGCYRVELPRGMDVNAYALKMRPARKALELVLNAARWMGPNPPPTRPTVLVPALHAATAAEVRA